MKTLDLHTIAITQDDNDCSLVVASVLALTHRVAYKPVGILTDSHAFILMVITLIHVDCIDTVDMSQWLIPDRQ